MIPYIWCCAECGTETELPVNGYDRPTYGSVFQCPGCGDVRAMVSPRGGGRAWIKVRPEDVEFYGLLETDDEDCDSQ
jgi:DNA-directed RNA polymerase subunit RPC12/RpoP